MRFRPPVPVLSPRPIAVAVLALLIATSTLSLAGTEEPQPPSQNASVTVLTISPNPVVVGQALTLTAKVAGVTGSGTGTPTGTVTFSEGSTQLGMATLDDTGTASVSSSNAFGLAVGNYPITAMYSGDMTFAPSSTVVILLVENMGSLQVSNTVLTINPNPAGVGQTITFTARVAGGIGIIGGATGTVTFYNGSTQLGTATLDATSTATITDSSLAAGTYSIIAVYSGDAKYQPSTSPPVTLVVSTLTPTTTTLTSSAPTGADFGTNVTFTATVQGGLGNPPTGTVTFLDGSMTLGTGTLTSGVATFSTTSLSVGTHTITAQYSGDSQFLSSTSAPLTQTINTGSGGGGGGGGGGQNFVLSVNPGIITVNQGANGTATVTVSPSGGFNQQITFICSGLPLYAACSFNPSTITPDGSNKPATTTLTVTTGTKNALLRPPALHPHGSLPANLLAMFSVGLLGLVQVKVRRGRPGRRGAKVGIGTTWFLFSLCLLATLWLVACGGSGSSANSVTPKGQTVVMVAGSYPGGGQSTSFTLNVQ